MTLIFRQSIDSTFRFSLMSVDRYTGDEKLCVKGERGWN